MQTSQPPPAASGVDVAELPVVEIEVPPAEAPRVAAPADKPHGIDQADPRLLPIAVAIVALVAIAALAWALFA